MSEIILDSNRIKVIKSIRLLQILSDLELEQLNESFVKHSYDSGSYLTKQGQPVDHLTILSEGKCKVTKRIDATTENEIGVMSAEKSISH